MFVHFVALVAGITTIVAARILAVRNSCFEDTGESKEDYVK